MKILNLKISMTEKKESLYIYKLIPNIVTIIGLCFGLFSIKYSMNEKWDFAVLLLVVAAFIDGLDGRIARMLNSQSNFGAQLDSLTDFINFGVAPAFLIYLWKTNEIKGLGWSVALFFVICQALRLARFNSTEDLQDDNFQPSSESARKLRDNFFTGVPAPTGAGLTMLPIIVTFLMVENFNFKDFYIHPIYVIASTALIAILMISTIPTISVKKMKIRKKYLSITLAIIGLFIIGLVNQTWIVLTLMGIIYLLTIPFSVLNFYRLKKRV